MRENLKEQIYRALKTHVILSTIDVLKLLFPVMDKSAVVNSLNLFDSKTKCFIFFNVVKICLVKHSFENQFAYNLVIFHWDFYSTHYNHLLYH